MGYEKVFEKPYPGGWKDLPDRTTLVTAEIMDDYDEVIEHIENHLNGSSAVFPITATGGMSQPVGIDENGRLFTYPSSGGTAQETSYDNTESGLESTDVQGAIDELAAGAGEKVTPVPKTEDMTQEVGIDENGELWTIPVGGGSGSSGLTKLWEYENSPAGATSGTMELSDDYTNYDFLIFSSARSNGSLQGNGIISTEDLDISKTLTSKVITIPGGFSAYGVITVTDSTHLAISSCSADYGFRAIYGYKAVEGSSITETVILDTPVQAAVSTPITLDEAITNYDQIMIRTYMNFNGMKLWSDNLFQSDDFILGDTNDQHWIFIDNNNSCYFSMSADGTQLVIKSVAGSVYIGEVVGINYSGGSSSDDIYSTEEVKTNKIWIDGKPVYRKVFTNLNVLETTNAWTTISSISIANVAVLINAYAIRSSDKAFVSDCSFKFDNSQLQYYITSRFPNTDIVVVEYTKTTD